MNTAQIQLDVVIIGAGIAGLWLQAQLRQVGWRTLLIENQYLGFGQTIASQGIIHGGTKYTLTGKVTPPSQALTDMPQRWRAGIESRTPGIMPDLTAARLLAEHQFLCSEASLASKFTAFAAGKVIRSKITALNSPAWPAFLAHPGFRGKVYQLAEPVLDIPSILHAFLQQIPSGEILLTDGAAGITIESEPTAEFAVLHLTPRGGGSLCIQTPQLIFTAGTGNEQLAELFPGVNFKTQRRPLQMVLVRFPEVFNQQLAPVYAHFLGHGVLPRATITTHRAQADGRTVLYLGGEIAESGVTRNRVEQIKAAQELLRQLLPTYPLREAEWATFRVDRAEPSQPGGKRPDTAIFSEHGHVIAAWPTKLALAPILADEITRHLGASSRPVRAPEWVSADILHHWPRPTVAVAPWDQEDLQWTKSAD